MLLTTKLELSDDERNYLESIGVTQKQLTALENDKLDAISDVNTLIKALFACTRKDDAWRLIEDNLEVVDFKEVIQCPFIELKRDAVNVYKYMYDHDIIDKKSYMYFEVLSGKLNNWDFWKQELDGLSVTQRLEILHDSYNDIFVNQNINPYQLGLVHLTNEQFAFIFKNLEVNEMIDFIFEDKPCIDVDPIHIQEFLMNSNLNPNKCVKYFNILFDVYNHLYDIEDDQYTDFYYSFFDFIDEYFKKVLAADDSVDIFSAVGIFSRLNIDKLSKMYKILDWMEHNESDLSFKLRFAINSPITLNYSYSIMNYIAPDMENIKVAEFLYADDNMGFVLSYKLHPLFDTSDFIIKYPFPQGCPMIYSKFDNMILIGDESKPYEESNFDFIDDYIYGEAVNDELFKNFNSIDEYKEFILAASKFRDEVNDCIG